jgi:hypothetical protein
MRIPNRSQRRLWSAAGASLLLASALCQAADVYVPDVVTRLFYDLPGRNNAVTNITGSPLYPDSADRIDYVTDFSSPQTANPNIENYGLVLRGLFTPPASGAYMFYVSGDDQCALYLSTDSTPANKRLIAVEPEWNGVRAFTTVDRRPLTARLDTNQVLPNISVPITLQAGTRYYMEAIMKEGGGGDSLAVGFTQGTTAATDDASVNVPGAGNIGTIAPDAPVFRVQPQDATVIANRPVTLTAYGQGTPANNTSADPTVIVPNTSIQWYQNGAAIANATNNTLVSPPLTAVGPVNITAVLTDGTQTVTSRVAVVTVTADATAPTIASAVGSATFTNVTVRFDEGMQAGPLGTAGNYTISGGVTVSGITVISDREVILNTSRQAGDQQFTLTVANQRDLAGNALSPNTAIFRSFVFRSGLAIYERWDAIGANNFAGMTTTTQDPDTGADLAPIPDRLRPSFAQALPNFQAPEGVGDNYGARISGYFVPPANGNYVFFVSADDRGGFWLSTDENPANKRQIALEPQWNGSRRWPTPPVPEDAPAGNEGFPGQRRSVDAPENRSDTWAETQWAGGAGAPITLVAGNRYYIEMIFTEGGGGDLGGATYKLASDPDPATQSQSTLTGSVIGTFVDPLGLGPIVTNAPAGLDFTAGQTINLTVGIDSARPLTRVQWYKNKRAIANGTNTTLTISNAGVEAVGDYYVEVANVNGQVSTFPDNNCRLLMRGGFVVEAEDFNYGGGSNVAAASTQPVGASLYYGLDGLPGIDFQLFNQSTAGAAANGNNYRNGYNTTNTPPEAVEFPTAPNELGNIDIIQDDVDTTHRRRGDYVATTNYKIGWNTGGEWFNYTRNFPPGNYNVVLAASRDGRAANIFTSAIELVTAGANTENATVQTVGTLVADGTGAWSSIDVIPYRDASGAPAVITLGTNSTVRLRNAGANVNGDDHDIDYLIFYPTTTPPTGGRITGFRVQGGNLVIEFTGTLTGSDTLGGSYTDVPGASPANIPLSGGSNQRFFRAR